MAFTAQAGVEAMANLQAPVAGQVVEFAFGGEKNREFMLDGKPFQIRAGEMHPQRIPREHWAHRIRAAKAMGLNTIAFYVFWNDIQQADGSYDYSGNRDIAAFIDLCAAEGMWVLFRPGPYVCGEWDLGGLPAYLMAEKGAKLRTMDNPAFMAAQKDYLEEMARIAAPRMCRKGGPILMVQLENEYGSYFVPHARQDYIKWLRDFWQERTGGPFYLSEGGTHLHLRHAIPGVALGLDPCEDEATMKKAQDITPDVPVFSSETYPGWLRHWGEGNWEPERSTLDSVRWYMQHGHSFNLFVLHGGTNFGLTAGANCTATGAIQPDLTSYDYGSPIGEQGNLTPEYYEYRSIIAWALPQPSQLPTPPAMPEAMELPEFTPEKVAALPQLAMQVEEKIFETPPTLESLGQNQGMVAYSTRVPAGESAFLTCVVHDLAQVYLGGRYLGTINRMALDRGIRLPEREAEEEIVIVVDTFGHINFSAAMETDHKGIVEEVKLGDAPLRGWHVSRLPLECALQLAAGDATFRVDEGRCPHLFRATVTLEKVADTFLDMAAWKKGYVWVNGHLLGRYWNIGPQERLYCPAEWLKVGENTIEVLDTYSDAPSPISGKTERNTELRKRTRNANNVW